MKHLSKLLLIFLLIPFFSKGQSNYQPGYVITLKGDTLYGFIDYKEWGKNPNAISFKKDMNASEIENFSPENAGSFAVTGFEYYERFILQVSQDRVDVNNLASRPDSSFLTDTVFLRMCTKGKRLTLYSYTDDIKPRYYILETGKTQPEELRFQAYYNPDAGNSIQINRFRIQLENLSQKYGVNTDKIKQDILEAKYREDEIAIIVQTINGGSSLQFTPKKLSGFRWFAGTGVNSSTLKFEGSGIAFAGGNGANSFFPKISAGMDFFNNKTIQRIILRAEVSFTVNQFNLSDTYNLSLTYPTTTSLNFKQYNNSITPQIIYNIYNKEQLKVFIDAGFSFNMSLYNHYQTITTDGGSFQTSSSQDDYPSFEKFWVSFPLKAGLIFNKKIAISVCYIPSAGLANYDFFSIKITSYQLGADYLF